MTPSDSSLAPSISPSPDYLPPPPRSVAPNLRALWMRVGFLAGMLLGPPLALWIGQVSAEDLRTLAARGHSTTGQFAVRG
jgi:hypothetical protein